MTSAVQSTIAEIGRIGADVAAKHADDVDRNARFPRETLDELRNVGALSVLVPQELGGAGGSIEDVARMCFELGRFCGASAMVFAMHQIQVASIVRHVGDSEWYASYLQELSAEQRLIASVTSEVGTGGDMGRSVAAVVSAADGLASFEKQAPTVSYGEHADDFFVTLRRDPDAAPGDQVIALVSRNQVRLEQLGTWDPLGMRGTCSPGFVVSAELATSQILPVPFSQVAAESMVPLSHIFWSHLWLGIARDAFDRARAFVRELAKRQGGETPPVAVRLSHLMSDLALLRAEVTMSLREFVEIDERSRSDLATMAAALRFNNLKIAASEQAPRICQGAMTICGIVGYKNDTPYSVGRHLRDTMSACLMVANERIHQTNASLLLVSKDV